MKKFIVAFVMGASMLAPTVAHAADNDTNIGTLALLSNYRFICHEENNAHLFNAVTKLTNVIDLKNADNASLLMEIGQSIHSEVAGKGATKWCADVKDSVEFLSK